MAESPKLEAVPVEQPMTAAKAREILDAEQKATVQACGDAIKVILAKHNCIMTGVPRIIPTGNGAYVLAADVLVQVKLETERK